MTQIIKVSMDELDRNHARIAVNKFLDKNGMYSHLGINILMIPEFMGWEVYYKDFKNGTFASSEKVDGKLTFYISEKVWTRKSALALCYMIAAEYYEKDYEYDYVDRNDHVRGIRRADERGSGGRSKKSRHGSPADGKYSERRSALRNDGQNRSDGRKRVLL